MTNNEIHLQDFNLICRICFSYAVNNIDLFSTTSELISDDNRSIAKAIMECAPVKIAPNDSLPQTICQVCLTQLNISYRFRNLCITSDGYLRHLISNLTDDNDEKIYFQHSYTANKSYQSSQTEIANDSAVIEEDIEPEIDNDVRISDDLDHVDDLDYGFIKDEIKFDNNEREKTNRDETQLHCGICQQNFSKTKYLFWHVRKVHIPLKCDNRSQVLPNFLSNDQIIHTNIELSDQNQFTENVIISTNPHESKLFISEKKKKKENDIQRSERFACYICKKIFTEFINLLKHIKLDHPDRKSSFQINIKDDKAFTDCIAQERVHPSENLSTIADDNKPTEIVEEKWFECNICEKTFWNKNNLNKHNEIVHFNFEKIKDNNKYTSKISKQSNTEFTSKNYHLEPCDLTNDALFQYSNIQLEVQSMKENVDTQQELIDLRNKELIYYQIPEVNKSGKPLKSTEIINEKLSNSGNKNKIKERFPCNICNKTLGTRSDVIKHKRIMHSNYKRYQCCKCGKLFRHSTSLTVHEIAHSRNYAKHYLCFLCNEHFKYETDLQTHKKNNHSGVEPYQCEVPQSIIACIICGRIFNKKSSLTAHLRIHTGERPYACDQCDKRFVRLSNLRQHERLHEKLQPYKCTLCNVVCKRPDCLKRHLRIVHLGERPYKCEACDSRFAQSANLKLHIINKHTDEKSYKCQFCLKMFNHNNHLKRHTNKQHSASTENMETNEILTAEPNVKDETLNLVIN